jgi:tetratricopeptide (TPR) repeat protein
VTNAADHLADALRDRYVLERELGRGGMATVYLAHDLKHDRPVALKVLHAELAAVLGPDRFLREIGTAARLQHPHILSVHDSGDAAGQLWFTMPYVEGESLRDRLRREQQLPLEGALRVATEAARALEYAHQHRVIHRDVKPENILLTADGTTLVADFGIARVLGGVGESLTEAGMAIGTPAYMSPEQASGGQVDARTDVYALGAVLYEMLAGEPPFTGPTAQAITAKRFKGEVPHVRQARSAVPETVDRAIHKALALVPADRFSTASGFAAALTGSGPAASVTVAAPTGRTHGARRHTVLMAGLGGLAVVGLFVGIRRLGSTPTLQQTGAFGARDVVVLADFVNRTRDSTLGATLTDAFRVDLGQSDAVQLVEPEQVASTLTQMRRTAEGPLDPRSAREVAQRQGVKAVVTGEIGAAGAGYLLSAAVVNAADGRALTAVRTTAADDRHLIAALDELSARLRERIGESLSRVRSTPPLEQVTTGSLDALRKYSAAFRAGWEAGNYERAIALLQEATVIDSSFATGYRLMAAAINNSGGAQSRRIEAQTRAYWHRERLPADERYLVTSAYQRFVEGDLEGAIESARRGFEENRTAVAGWLAAMLRVAGRCEEADSLFDIAIANQPWIAASYVNKLSCGLQRGRVAVAESTLARLARATPRSPYVNTDRARLWAARGEPDSAIEVLSELRRDLAVSQNFQGLAASWQARASEVLGRITDAERYWHEHAAISQARGLPANQLVDAVRLAELALRYRRRPDQAVRTVQEALRQVPLDSLPPVDRPYLAIARFWAEVGRPAEARRLVAAYERAVPAGVRRGQAAAEAAVAAMLALGEHRSADAIAAARTWNRSWEESLCTTCGLYELALAFERAGQPDSAVVMYRQLVDAPGYGSLQAASYALAPAWRRLGELYEERGQRAEALEAYGRFAALWKDADSSLQPAVREVRQRMAALAGER